jgi:hypothetical protein
MKPSIVILTLILAAAVLLAGCDVNQLNGGQTTSWIDAPLNNSSLPLGLVKVISHSSDQAGIAQVELSVNGTVIRTDANQDTSQTLVVMGQDWTPSAPGTYTLQVRAQNTAGHWSDYALVNVTVEGMPTNTFTPVATSTPTQIPSSTSTPTSSAPTFTLVENAFCRKGPDTSFSDVTAIPKGDTVDIQGVSEDGFWYFVFWKQFDVKCWVAAHAGQASGNVQGVPVLVAPNTATPKPLPEPTGRRP